MTLIGLDAGNKQTKIKNSDKTMVIPSYFLNSKAVGTRFNNTNPEGVYEFKSDRDEDSYFWGKNIHAMHHDAETTETLTYDNRYENLPFQLLCDFALGLAVKDLSELKDGFIAIDVYSGLPTSDYLEQDKIDSFKSAIMGEHNVTIDGQEIKIKVNHLSILPQPIGSLYDQMLDNRGYMIEDRADLMSSNVGIIDVGGGTVLIDTLSQFNLDPLKRHQFNSGVNELYAKIAAQIGDVSVHQLAINIRNRDFIYKKSKRKQFDFEDVFNSVSDAFNKDLVTRMKTTFKSMDDLDYIIFTGGGSQLLDRDYILSEFKDSIILKDAEISNVNGFYKHGQNIERRKEARNSL